MPKSQRPAAHHDCTRELLQGECSFVIGKRAGPSRSAYHSTSYYPRHADAMIALDSPHLTDQWPLRPDPIQSILHRSPGPVFFFFWTALVVVTARHAEHAGLSLALHAC